ncbi:MAG: glycosyl transferase, partial [Gammaproteobacteria bacterium]|nr:glycosyl transferase [Gammaproteobacteria bacterium]
LLFFVSTVGSAAGKLGTSFYFVLWFEVNRILWGAVTALLIAAAIILVAGYMRGSLSLRVRGHET